MKPGDYAMETMCGPQSLKHFLSGPLQKTSANPQLVQWFITLLLLLLLFSVDHLFYLKKICKIDRETKML